MNKLGRITRKLLTGVSVLVITLLAACSTSSTVTICHATGDPAIPYEEITGLVIDLKEHLDHPNDFLPAPANGCPDSLVVVGDGKISICHATGNENDPYDEIMVSANGLNGHGDHLNDILPVPEGGCPETLVVNEDTVSICHATGNTETPYEELTLTRAQLSEHSDHTNDIYPAPTNGCPTTLPVISDGKITICHATGNETSPYDEISVNVNDLDGHETHKGDIIPAPEIGCPTSSLVVTDNKITICHASDSNPTTYNEITVSINGLNGHGRHTADIIPMPEGGCPVSPVVVSDGKISICHATGSVKNPYNEIMVSVNGLNGHGKHPDDIIPAPAGGCPITNQ